LTEAQEGLNAFLAKEKLLEDGKPALIEHLNREKLERASCKEGSLTRQTSILFEHLRKALDAADTFAKLFKKHKTPWVLEQMQSALTAANNIQHLLNAYLHSSHIPAWSEKWEHYRQCKAELDALGKSKKEKSVEEEA
jgi:hypothetical protein